MAARAMWKGVIRFDEFSLPVKLYSAVEDQAVHFHLLHDQDMVRVRQRMVQPETGETVPAERIRKGYEVHRGEFVLLEEEDLASLQPPDSRDIDIRQFVPASAINHQWYDRPYWLGPDGSTQEYFALSEALSDRQLEGVAQWVMRKKRYVGALRSEQGYLALVRLRHTEEVIPASALEPPGGRDTDERERAMAGQFIEALQSRFDPQDFHNGYRQRMWELIETKRQGLPPQPVEAPQKQKQMSLADSLRESLQALKAGR